MSHNLLIDFQDTKSTVELPLGENLVLFGENGTGKTRILKAIQTIIELSKVNSNAKATNIIKELNIENFRLNGVDYEELFQVKKRLVSSEKNQFNNYFKKYKELFEIYVDLKYEYISTPFVIDNFSNAEIRMCREALEYFKRHDFPNEFPPRLIRKWEKDTRRIPFESAADNEVFGTIKLSSELFEQERLINQIINNFIHNTNSISHSSKKSEFNKDTERLKSELAGLNSVLISTGEKEFELFFNEIRKRILDYKSILFNSLWNSGNRINEVIENITVLNNQTKKFNEVISRYFDLIIELDETGEFSFYKCNQKLEISKFSSGERNIIFLFLKLIFTNVDIYLIDEPEISLSLSYQRRIIGDIFEVLDGKTVIIATHAPFIYKDFKDFDENNKVIKIRK